MPSFPDPVFTAGKTRYQTALRREILDLTGYTSGNVETFTWATGILKVTDSCLYNAGGRYRIFLKSQKKIPRSAIVFG